MGGMKKSSMRAGAHKPRNRVGTLDIHRPIVYVICEYHKMASWYSVETKRSLILRAFPILPRRNTRPDSGILIRSSDVLLLGRYEAKGDIRRTPRRRT
jgi:hypothetical protein